MGHREVIPSSSRDTGQHLEVNFWLLISVLQPHCWRTPPPLVCHPIRKYKQTHPLPEFHCLILSFAFTPISKPRAGPLVWGRDSARGTLSEKQGKTAAWSETDQRNVCPKHQRTYYDNNSPKSPSLRFLGALFAFSVLRPLQSEADPAWAPPYNHTLSRH